VIAHWDEAESDRAEAGHVAGAWTDLGTAAGTKMVGVSRMRSNKIYFRGLGLIARLDDLDYDDGEPG
jgi:hypothetical protein